MMKSTLTFLGTGTSSGLPVIGCDCPVCRSDDPRDARLRTSAYLETSGGAKILIDAGPDFRLQALRQNIRRVDALLVTHSHYDHIGGIDELRQINFIMGKPIDVYSNAHTLAEIRERFRYIFMKTQEGGGKPKLELHEVRAGEPFAGGGTEILPVEILHGEIPIFGYVFGKLAYITDASAIPEATYGILARRGVDTLVVNALRYEPHPTHFSLSEALEAVKRIAPKSAYLLHFTHHFRHAELAGQLPANVFPAYDNLTIEC